MGSTTAGHGYNQCKNYILLPSYGPRSLIDKIFIFYFLYTYSLTKTNEISFNTHLLVIAYYVLIYMYSVTL